MFCGDRGKRLIPSKNSNPRIQKEVAIKIVFFLRNGGKVEWPVPNPEGFSFLTLCKSIRADGHFLTNEFYLNHDEIACIGLDGGSASFMQPPHPTPQ